MRRAVLVAVLALAPVMTTLPATAYSPPEFIGTVTRASAGTDPAYDSEVAVAPDGTATAVWTVGPPGGPFTITTATRPRKGVWSAPEPVGPVVIDDALPHVAVDAAGNATVAWRDHVGSTYYFKSATRSPGGSWSAPYEVSVSAAASAVFDLAVGPEGTPVMTWRSTVSGTTTVYAARRLNGTWGLPVNVSGATVPTSIPVVTVSPTGTATVAWVAESGGGEIVRTATRPLGEAWGPPTAVGSTNPVIGVPALVTAADGSTWAAWTQFAGLGYQVNAAQRPVVGGWSPASAVSDLTAVALDPELVAGADGTLSLVWSSTVNVADERVTALVRTPDGAWSPVVTLSPAFEQLDSVHAAVGPDGSVTALWDGLRGSARVVETSVRLPGGPWGAVRTLDASSGGDSALGVDALGNGVATWDSSGLTSVIHVLSTVLDAGSPGIAPPTLPGVGYAGRPLAFSVAPPTDAASGVSTTWLFGDGTTAPGTSVSHAYAAGGTYTVGVTATDEAGHGVYRTGTVLVYGKPTVTKVHLQRHRIVRRGPAYLKKVRLAFVLAAPGRVVVRLVKKGKPARAKLVLADLSSGRHRVVLRTRIDGVRLKPGLYKLKLVASNPAGTAKTKVVRLRVLDRQLSLVEP